MPFKTRRFKMQMAVHYSDFRFTFPIKFKFNFIDFALRPLHLLLKKETSFPTSYILSCLPTRGLLVFFKLSRASHTKKAVPHVNSVSLTDTMLKRSMNHRIILNSRHIAFVLRRLCSRERFSLDGLKVIGFV